MSTFLARGGWLLWAALVGTSPAGATVTQVDGSILPQNPAAMQGYLDAEGEGGPPAATALDAVIDADRFPEVYLPNTAAPVSIRLIGEGGGFENSFGWYNVGDDITTDAGRARNLHPVMGCGTAMVNGAGAEDPASLSDAQLLSAPHNQHHHGAPASYVVSAEPGAATTVDFGAEQAAGRYRGGFIAFYVISPEAHASPFNCGDFKVDLIGLGLFGRIYHSQADLNNDGDFVHNLVYRSKRAADRFYFGFEDLFRGGDNDFEDVLTQVTGLTPQCAPTLEVCDGADNDCDSLVDGADPDAFGIGDPCACDGVALPCMGGARLGQCLPGATVCVGGQLECAPLRGPSAEICDGIDNNCNGLIDDVPGPCLVEICNGEDDDGDGLTDELPLPDLGAPCGIDQGECERGVTCCAAGGVLDCCAETGPMAEVCDCLDNNCDGRTDEDDSRACYDGLSAECDVGTGTCQGICRFGTQLCTTAGCPGAPGYSCTGQVGPRPEECNCLDDDCDGLTDDGATCASGAPCLDCACATTCNPDEEFPCAAGQICDCSCGAAPPCHCGPDPCQTLTCAAGELCDSCTATCVDPCAECPAGATCCAGQCCQAFASCVSGQCLTCADPRVGCPEAQVCVGGRCVADPCASVKCVSGEFCLDGQCRPVCPRCPDGERCQDGVCVVDPCAGVVCLGASQVCCAGTCGHDPCVGNTCAAGEVCDSCTGVCASDPCLRLRCPDGYACLYGECAPGARRKSIDVAAGGAGGCACAVGGRPGAGLPALLAVVWLAAAWRRRRGAWLVVLLAFGAGCEVRSIRITEDLGVFEADGAVPVPEGCQPVPESCNGVDDDCNGLIDDGDPGGGQTCGIEEGACQRGTTVCSAGQVICQGDVRPEPEACDTLDNDCDTETDEVFDFCNDPAHCGSCFGSGGAGQSGACAIVHAVAACDPAGCAGGCAGCAVCRVDLCELGWVDCQGDDPPNDCNCPCSMSPGPEVCDDIDNDCDGSVDEGVFTGCFSGPPGTWNVGECSEGQQACLGGVFGGPCMGEVTPIPEACNALDDDCDGVADLDGAGRPLEDTCYDGAPGTEGVGTCVAGTQTCAFGAWGPCDGQVVPGSERCADGVDTDCDTLDDGQEGCASPIGVDSRLDEPGGAEGSAAGAFHSYDLVMAAAGSPAGRTVYVVWTDLRNGAADVFLRRSVDGGATFEDIRNLTLGTATPSVVPVLAAVHDPGIGQDRVHVAYQTVVGGLRRIVVQQSSDSGASFSFPASPAGGLLDAGGSNDSFHHHVSADGGRAIVAWEEMDAGATTRRIKSRASLDGGVTFAAERESTIASGPTPGAGRPVTAVTGAGRFIVVWRERRAPASTFDVFANHTDDDTTPFAAGNERRLDGDATDGRISDRPLLRAVGDNVYVVWEDAGTAAGGGADVMLARSLDGATTFSAEVVLDDPTAEVSASARPTLAVDARTPAGGDDGVHVAWEDLRQGSQVFATRSLDSGATFSPAVRASSQAGGPVAGATRWPSLTWFGVGALALAYENDASGARHVYLSLSIDGGSSWSAEQQELDTGGGPAERPVLAPVDDGAATGAIAAWNDRRIAPGVHADPYSTRVLR